MDNKFHRYLIYAIGEIVLVVIGILIALQINNWNQDRVDKKKSIEYHQRMIEDLEQTSEFMVSVIQFSNRVRDSIRQGVEILESKKQSKQNAETLNFALGNLFRLSRNIPVLTTYQEMESSGNLGMIRNPQLRKEISSYLVNWELVATAAEDLNEKVNQLSFLDPYVKYESTSTFRETKVSYDFKSLSANNTAINTLSRYAFHWESKSAFAEILNKSAQRLISSIEQELAQLRK